MSASKIHATLAISAVAFLTSMSHAQIEVQRIAGKPLTDAIIAVETAGIPDHQKDICIGDGGKAIGALQIHRGVVQDVNRVHGLDYYHSDAFDRAKAERIFWRYMEIYATEKRLGRPVTDEDRALIWHLGPTGFAGRNTTHRLRAQAYLRKLRPYLK